jgi:beta-glucosidase
MVASARNMLSRITTQPTYRVALPNRSLSIAAFLFMALVGLESYGCTSEDQVGEGTAGGGVGQTPSSDAGNRQDSGAGAESSADSDDAGNRQDSGAGAESSADLGIDSGPGADAGVDADAAEPFDAGGPSIDEAKVDAEVDEILSRLTLEQKTAQMTEVQFEDVSADSARTGCYGSIFNGGEELPFDNNPASWAKALDELQKATIEGCGIPMLYGIDAVHGNAKVIGSTVFPHEVGLGATRDADLVERIGRAVGRECRGAGIHLVFAPTLAVARDERWGRTYESFGETPELNQELGAAYIQGLQGGGDLSDPGAVAATAKHYVGDGATKDGKNAGVVEVGEPTLRALHVPPYEAAIARNVAAIMPSYHQWLMDGQLQYMSVNAFALTDLLKDELGFEGFCLSDYDAVPRTQGGSSDGMPLPYTQSVVSASVNAGMDMAMVAMEGGVGAWLGFLRSGQIPEARIDDAVRRILRIKVSMGLFDDDFAKAYSNATLRSQTWSQEHQDLAREAVQKSLVLLKNDGILPLDKTQPIKVVGPYADSMGAQAGGWTVSWQGSDQYGTNQVKGETILAGLKTLGKSVEYASSVASGDTVVAVVGERPSAEQYGDDGVQALDGSSHWASVRLHPQIGYDELEQALAAGAKVILVILSGRPLVIEDTGLVDQCSAIVAAWLPGSRGIGVADALFGDVDFSGKLPHTWPRSFEQIPVNVDQQSDEPGNDAQSTDVLYPYGYGLSYR